MNSCVFIREREANATSEFPGEAREALKHIRSVAMRIDDVIDGLMYA
jgi:hypothetical protein